MQHRFFQHALQQIERRGLNLDDVVRTIESPEKVSEVDGLEVYLISIPN